MNKIILQFLGLVLFLLAALPAKAGWMAYGDFSSCPRKYIPNTSGQDGPYNSSAECHAAIANVTPLPCARYSCSETGGGNNSSAAPAAPGHELDKNIGDALAAGMTGKISGADAIGLA